MNPFQIKICGITLPNDAIEAYQCGADAIGLNFYQDSPRFIADSDATAIIDSIRQVTAGSRSRTGAESSTKTPKVKIFGVFVNMSADDLVRKTVELELDGIQLHGDEDPSLVGEIRQQLKKPGQPCQLIRAVRTKPADSVNDETQIQAIESEIAAWSAVAIDAILLDAAVPGEFGGTGKTVDWYAVPRLSQKLPLILAGGLNPDNVERAIEISQVRSVDVASGVESKPGMKDRDKVSEFVSAAKRGLGL
jgi:phosphoribosylanthranilate isomerase